MFTSMYSFSSALPSESHGNYASTVSIYQPVVLFTLELSHNTSNCGTRATTTIKYEELQSGLIALNDFIDRLENYALPTKIFVDLAQSLSRDRNLLYDLS
jgi:hypothetical protein